jgi:hypothetical protein
VIEQVMIFALGFLVAGLAALAFAPAFWRRANRLTRRQLEMQIPLSVQEILAERDQLRAEFAVERCRLELRAQQLSEEHAADLVQLGRHAIKMSALESELKAGLAEVEAADRARAQDAVEMNGLRAELGASQKALYDAEGLLERRQNEFLEYVRLQESMKVLAEMRFGALAASDARVAGLELRLGEVSRNLLEAEQKLTQKDLHARGLADVLNGVRQEREAAEAELKTLRAQREAETRHSNQLAEELAVLQARQDGDVNQLKTLMVKANVSEAALEDALRREKSLLSHRDLMVERLREAEQNLEDHARLRAEYSATLGALEVARKRCEELSSAVAASQRAGTTGDASEAALLRQSISEIGAAIIRQIQPNGGEREFAPLPGLLRSESEEPRVSSREPAAP